MLQAFHVLHTGVLSVVHFYVDLLGDHVWQLNQHRSCMHSVCGHMRHDVWHYRAEDPNSQDAGTGKCHSCCMSSMQQTWRGSGIKPVLLVHSVRTDTSVHFAGVQPC